MGEGGGGGTSTIIPVAGTYLAATFTVMDLWVRNFLIEF